MDRRVRRRNSARGGAVNATVTEAADRIALAARNRQPIAPVRTLIGESDIDLAYAVQQELISRRIEAGAVVVGRKIGLTSPAVQRQLGVDQPDFGVLFADMDMSAETIGPFHRLLQPKAEAGNGFGLKDELEGEVFSSGEVSFGVDHA